MNKDKIFGVAHEKAPGRRELGHGNGGTKPEVAGSLIWQPTRGRGRSFHSALCPSNAQQREGKPCANSLTFAATVSRISTAQPSAVQPRTRPSVPFPLTLLFFLPTPILLVSKTTASCYTSPLIQFIDLTPSPLPSYTAEVPHRWQTLLRERSPSWACP